MVHRRLQPSACVSTAKNTTFGHMFVVEENVNFQLEVRSTQISINHYLMVKNKSNAWKGIFIADKELEFGQVIAGSVE